MKIAALWQTGAAVRFTLREIAGRKNSVATRGVIRREGAAITVTVEAADPDMAALIATAPDGRSDTLLYEEDCLQVATASPGAEGVRDFLLINPLGKRKGTAAAARWPGMCRRHARGWVLSLRIPIPPERPCMGFSLHRFFRGVNNEVQGLAPVLPHPLAPEEFAVLCFQPVPRPAATAAQYRDSVRAARAAALERTVADVRRRIGAARNAGGPPPTLATARALALERARAPVAPYRYWNENHFQLALLNLWDIERDPRWVELAVARMDATWRCRADRLGQEDSLWRIAPPTWLEVGVQAYASTLCTGVVLEPIARLIRLVAAEPALKSFRPKIESWIPLCHETIAFHDREWVELADGTGIYIEPYPKGPRRIYPADGSRVNPLNRTHFFALPMLDLGQALRDGEYLRRVAAMARYFRKHCEVLANGSLVWEYLVGAYPAEGEDNSHGVVQAIFAERCCRAGIVFTERDLRRIAATLAKNILRYGDVPCGSLRGFHPGLDIAAVAWSPLCRYVPETFPALEAVLATALAEAQFDFHREGWGIRLLTLLEIGRRLAAASPQGRSGAAKSPAEKDDES